MTPERPAPARYPHLVEDDAPRDIHEPSVSGHSKLDIASVLAQLDDVQQALSTTRDILEQMVDGTPTKPAPIHRSAIRTVPRWHFPMLNDVERNDAFVVALERTVRPGAHVLDIGSGTGLLAMMAVQAGAGKVTTCEANPLLAEIARQVIEAHGLSDVITVVPKMSTALRVGEDLDQPVELVVSEIVDCGLIGEGLLPTIRHARAHLLRPGGQLLPRAATLRGALVDSAAVSRLNRVSTAAGFDLRLLNGVATQGHFPVRLSTWPHRLLSDDVELAAFDLMRDPLVDEDQRTAQLPVATDGLAHGVVAWFELELGGGVVLRNSPDNLGSHWMQAFVPFDNPLKVWAGSVVEITLRWQAERLSAQATSDTSTKLGVDQ